jgi:ATP-binding protein involved in chromosome partitioning
LAVRSGSDAGTPIVVADPQSPQAKTYRDIAKKLMTIADIRYEDSA